MAAKRLTTQTRIFPLAVTALPSLFHDVIVELEGQHGSIEIPMIVPRAISPEILALFDDAPEAEHAAPLNGDRYLLFANSGREVVKGVADLHQWSFDRHLKNRLGCPGGDKPAISTAQWEKLEREIDRLVATVDDFREAGTDKIYLVQELFALKNSLVAAERVDLARKIERSVLRDGQRGFWRKMTDAVFGGEGDTAHTWSQALQRQDCDDIDRYTLSRAYYEWCCLARNLADFLAAPERSILESYLDHCQYIYKNLQKSDDTTSLLRRYRILIAEMESRLCQNTEHYNLLSLQELETICAELEHRFQARVSRLLRDKKFGDLRQLLTPTKFSRATADFLKKLPVGKPIGETLAEVAPYRELMSREDYEALVTYQSLEADRLDKVRRAIADRLPDRADQALKEIEKNRKALPHSVAPPPELESLRDEVRRLREEIERAAFVKEEDECLASARAFVAERKPDQAARVLNLVRERRQAAIVTLDSLPDLTGLETQVSTVRQEIKQEADWKRQVRALTDRGHYAEALKQIQQAPDRVGTKDHDELREALHHEVADAVMAHAKRDVRSWRKNVEGLFEKGDFTHAVDAIDLFEPDKRLAQHYRKLWPDRPIDFAKMRNELRSSSSDRARKAIDGAIETWRAEVGHSADAGDFDGARQRIDGFMLSPDARRALDYVDEAKRPDIDGLRAELHKSLEQAALKIEQQAKRLKEEKRLIDLLLLIDGVTGIPTLISRRRRIERDMARGPYEVVQFGGRPTRWFYSKEAVMWRGGSAPHQIPWEIGFISRVQIKFAIEHERATLTVGRDGPASHRDPSKPITSIEIERNGRFVRLDRGESAELAAKGMIRFSGDLAVLNYRIADKRFLVLNWQRPDPAIIVNDKPLAESWKDWEKDAAFAVVIGV